MRAGHGLGMGSLVLQIRRLTQPKSKKLGFLRAFCCLLWSWNFLEGYGLVDGAQERTRTLVLTK